jgi:hypothetical protein
MLSRLAIFAAGHLLIGDATHGRPAINIWHNAPYILFIQPAGALLALPADLHRDHGLDLLGRSDTPNALFFAGLPATVVLYRIVNFRHRIVDSLIWKVRKPPIRRHLVVREPKATVVRPGPAVVARRNREVLPTPRGDWAAGWHQPCTAMAEVPFAARVAPGPETLRSDLTQNGGRQCPGPPAARCEGRSSARAPPPIHTRPPLRPDDLPGSGRRS